MSRYVVLVKYLIVFLLFRGTVLAGAVLDILCTTDLHGHFEKMPQIAFITRSFSRNALRIDAGDTLTGTFYSDLCHGQIMIELLNKLDFDVWVPGNHDFEVGFYPLEKQIRAFRGTVLGAQWHWNNIRPLKWKVFKRNGIRAAVIGATDPAMFKRCLPGIDGGFDDLIKNLNKLAPEIFAAAPDVVILAVHNGLYARYAGVVSLANACPWINLFLGGHSHQEVWGRKVKHSYFVQAGCHGNGVAHVSVKFDPDTKKILRIESEFIPVDNNKKDPDIDRYCRRISAISKKLSGRKIIDPAQKLRLPADRREYSALGEGTVRLLMQTAGADAAMFLLPLVRTKDDIRRKYAVTDGDLYRLFPYRNRLCSVKITRADLDELEMYIADYSKKRKVRFFFAGALKCDSRGKFSLDRESVKIALSDFLLFQIPVLQRKLSMEPGSWRLIPGLFERDVVRQALENGLFPAGLDHSVSR